MLDVTLTAWLATLGGLLAIMAFDQWVAHRKGEHEFSVGEATRWVVFYVGLAIAFGLGLWFFGGHQAGAEFFAGYLTEYSLSVDNLFVFVIIMSSFAVPRAFQHKVLLVGIALALLLRGIFIAVGAAAINQFVWVFFVFGAFLVFTAWKLARSGEEHDEPGESKLVALMSKVLPTTDEYDGERVFTKVGDKRVVTPMLLVMVAIGSTDLLFALDSIPAIFGLTKEPYIVFTANAFALMGLRQLYFLLDGLLDRLVYLSKGLAVILGFIGAKLVLHAAHEYGASVPDIGIAVSLGVIVVTLAATTVLSLRATR
ncbi:MAG: tellurium resistance protein TerC [Frankiales bacterium]|nr:tellurium resistance protein TerC [Frankiales bacterium]